MNILEIFQILVEVRNTRDFLNNRELLIKIFYRAKLKYNIDFYANFLAGANPVPTTTFASNYILYEYIIFMLLQRQ